METNIFQKMKVKSNYRASKESAIRLVENELGMNCERLLRDRKEI